MSEEERLEEKSERIEKDNDELLSRFADWLAAKGLSQKTIDGHHENVEFYINDYLQYYDPHEAEVGVERVGSFLGFWFIKKAMWATQSSIRSNATSIKKFYQFMLEIGRIDQESYDEMRKEIKEDMPKWLETMRKYDDLDLDSEDIWDD